MKMPKEFFPQRPDSKPFIYAYSEPGNANYKGYLKVGFTSIDVEERVRQQFPTLKPGAKPYSIDFREPAVRADGSSFMDHEVHDALERMGHHALRTDDGKKTEWYRAKVSDVRAAWIAVRDRTSNIEKRDMDFKMRPEQSAAVKKTLDYFKTVNADHPTHTPKMLWNAKMRFGKTFATYQLAKKMGAKRVLVLTFKPAVLSAWEDDLMRHVDFEGWQFVTREGTQYEDCDPSKPIVCFGSFQDFLGRDSKTKCIKPRNEWVHLESWDLVVFDEYHFGAWNDNSKKLFQQDDEDEAVTKEYEDTSVGKVNTGNEENEGDLPIETKYYLFLSGTPFRALNSGEFIEDQVFNWTYSDEQRSKQAWPTEHPGEPNPYATLPRMVMLTYKIPDEITEVAKGGEYDSFDLNMFFEAEGEGKEAQFVLKDYVQDWLDLIRGAYRPATLSDLKQGAEKPPFPYSDTRLRPLLNHTLWYLPRVNACWAMYNLMNEPHNKPFWGAYTVNVCAGTQAGVGLDALTKVQATMEDPLSSATITLSCGKLTTGVTVRPWTGILMLTNISSPESYFQAAFRVQNPWTVNADDGSVQIIKDECYLFDFALDRSLRMVSDYSCRLSINETGPEQKVGEFINFLPVLAYDGFRMKEVSASEILDIAMAGTSATLLARRWESALLVHVDNATLQRLLDNEQAMKALANIEGFRSLNQDIETIINRTEAVKKAKKEAAEKGEKVPKEITAEEKELKSKRKQIQEKLIKFATRIPVFMYLTDFREECLKDVITQLEPGLFKKVTGLEVSDFELLVSLGVFADDIMNDAVYKFRRYEDASLVYTGINRHEGETVGLFDTKLSEFDYLTLKQQDSLVTPEGFDAQSGKKDEIRFTKIPELKYEKPAHGKIETYLVENLPASKDDKIPEKGNDDALMNAVMAGGFEFVDRRSAGGNLWIIGGRKLDARMKTLEKLGYKFKFKQGGGKATKHKDAWWIAGSIVNIKPEQPIEEEKPLVTQEQLDALEIGDTVFHKAFGYGEILDLAEGYITIDFHEGKKKPFRKFIFPGPFYQGILQIG